MPPGLFIYHRPVLLQEVLWGLQVRPGSRYIDCTVGEGGHAQAILEACQPGGKLLGLDADPEALQRAQERLAPYAGAFFLLHANFVRLGELAPRFGFTTADGILFDLGLSSLQLEGEERGFTFQQDQPLDMRLDPGQQEVTAALILNTYGEAALARLLATYGEEPQAHRIARAVVHHRPLETTGQLAALVEQVVRGRRGRLHPATRTFQALRIAVNTELENLARALEQALALLRPGTRLVVTSYHSLEDRVTKHLFRREASTCICPPETPVCQCHHQPSLRWVNRKVITPSLEEVQSNPRSRSARMRIIEHV